MARRDRSLVRASDLAAWTYCRRAWWLAHVRGAPHERPEQLAQGQVHHQAHGQSVRQAHTFQRLGLILVGLGLLLLVAAFLALGLA